MALAADAAPRPASFWYRLGSNPLWRATIALVAGSRRRQLMALGFFPVLWLLATHLGPLLQMARISFYDAYPPAPGQAISWTFDNYLVFIGESIYLAPWARTLVFSLTVTACTLVTVYPLAYYLAKKAPRDRRIRYLLLLLVPFWVSYIIRTFALMVVLGNKGFLNIVLIWLGLIERPIPFMYTWFSLGMGVLYLTALYMLLPLYAAIEKIDDNVLQAAADLGAGPWKRFWRITVPLSREGIGSGCTLVFLLATGYYAVPLLLGGPGTTLFAETIGNFFHVAGDRWPTGAAFAIIMFVTSLVMVGIFLKVLGRRGASILP